MTSTRATAVLVPVLSVLLSFLVGGVIVVISGHDPVAAYVALLQGAFGSVFNLANTLTVAVPLMLAGLGVAFTFRAGLFNIGAEGQYWLGSIAAAWVGYAVHGLPVWVHLPLALLAGTLAGALWAALIPGVLKAWTGAHEVITTMMMSYIAINLARYLIEGGPMMAPGYTPQSPAVLPTATLPALVPGTQLSWGLVLAVLAAVAVWFVLYRTTFGFEVRAAGLNGRAARYAGMNVARIIVLAMFVSGALAGLAGAVQTLGVNHRLFDAFNAGYGYTAIVVALLGKNNPWGVLAAAVLFGALNAGASAMQMQAGVPAHLVDVVQGMIIFFIAVDGIIRSVLRRTRKEAAQA